MQSVDTLIRHEKGLLKKGGPNKDRVSVRVSNLDFACVERRCSRYTLPDPGQRSITKQSSGPLGSLGRVMSVYVGESRGELVAWLNELLAPQQITKLEQCGTGSIYCQIVDSIYGDVPLQRVKFNSKMEYEYLDNFKVLQKAFNTHRIDKPIPVDRLVKCKMQDNLEFLQWLKKYWDTNSRGEGYDAVGRAGGIVPSAPPPSRAPAASSRANGRAPISAAGSRNVSTASSAQMNGLRAQVAEIQASCDGLEKERDFYFDKLRSIELIVQQRTAIEGMEVGERDTLAKLQEILYSTVEGFEVPDNGQAVLEEEEGDQELAPEEEETF